MVRHLALLLVTLPWTTSLAFAEVPAADVTVAQEAYKDSCARCHGIEGRGDGPDASKMFPRPRNFAEGIFKFRTTESGEVPTDSDLFHTISTGLPGSRMPDFQRLPEEIRWQLVGYIKSFSGAFEGEKPQPMDLGKDPGPRGANRDRGRELYTQLGCNACHGAMGRADGPSAATLVDNWAEPIRSADLTQASTYRGGSGPKEIATRMMTGIDGTPMPSYAEAVSSKEDLWHLAYYVHSLQEKQNFSRIVEAIQVDEAAFDPEASYWSSVPRTDVRLGSLFYRQGKVIPTTVQSISVQAVYNEGELLLRLAWNDPTHWPGSRGAASDSGSQTIEAPPDALALLFLLDRRLRMQIGSLRNWTGPAKTPALEVMDWVAKEQGPQDAKASYADGRWVVLLKRPPVAAASLMGFLVWDGGNAEEGRHRASSTWLELVLK